MGSPNSVAPTRLTDGRSHWLLVVPVFQSVYPKPFANFLAMALCAASREGHAYAFAPYIPERQLLHSAMNSAATIVVEHGFDGMIVCDDDCGPPFDAIPRLLRRHEAGHEIVCGLGFMRNFPHTTTMGRYYPEGPTLTTDPTGTIEWTGFQWLDDYGPHVGHDGLIPVDFCGFPIALISKAALDQMERPWFGTEINGGTCTHDVYFGYRAHQAKIPIQVDADILCSHLSEAPWLTVHNREIVRQAHVAFQENKAAVS